MFNFIIYIHSYIPVIKKGELKEIKAIILCLVNCNTRWYFLILPVPDCIPLFQESRHRSICWSHCPSRRLQFSPSEFLQRNSPPWRVWQTWVLVVLNLLSSSHLRTNGINKTQCGLENYTASSLTSINGRIPHSRS